MSFIHIEMHNSVNEREWVFWALNTSYPNEDKQHFLCRISKDGIRIESNPPIHIEIKDVKRCMPEPATLRPFRVLVRLELFSQELPISLYVVNPVNPHGYGTDGYIQEASNFADVVNLLSQNILSNVPSNPYVRELSRKGKKIPAIVFSNKYLSPMEYLEATQSQCLAKKSSRVF